MNMVSLYQRVLPAGCLVVMSLNKLQKILSHYKKSSESGIRVSFLPNTKKRDINKLLSVIKKADKIQGTITSKS